MLGNLLPAAVLRHTITIGQTATLYVSALLVKNPDLIGKSDARAIEVVANNRDNTT
jgi:hypothetical protein